VHDELLVARTFRVVREGRVSNVAGIKSIWRPSDEEGTGHFDRSLPV